MKLSDQIFRKPLFVAFGQSLQGGGITSVDLAATRNASTVTLTASDGSAAPVAGADTSTAGVMTASDKVKLDGLSIPTTYDVPTRFEAAAAEVDGAVTHIRAAGYSSAGDGGGGLYERIVAEPVHNLKFQSADGAWWELVPEASGVNVRQAGAAGDGVADDTQPIQDCVDFIGSSNGRVVLPSGTYATTAAIIVEHNIVFEGEGSGALANARSTIVKPAAGVTGFMVRRGAFDPSDGYGDNSLFRNLEVEAAGKNATATTGTMAAGSKTLSLAAAADFSDGDIIMVRGAGEAHTLMNPYYLTAATTAGSPVITLSQTAGIYPGMIIDVAGAGFPADSYVVSRAGTTVTMSANAASSVAAGAITYWNDLAVQVMSGGGTTALTVNEAAFRAVGSVDVIHYDCGVYSQSRMSMENCTMRGFQGAGLFIHAGGDVDSVSTRPTNANNWRVDGVVLAANRNGLRLKGNDANAGTAIGADVGSNSEYGLVDASFLGNYYFGAHASGGYGYMTVFLNASATFVGCYTEGGTNNSFAEGTSVIGGAMGGLSGNAPGGIAVTPGTNIITQSYTNFQPSWADFGLYLGDINPNNGLMRIDASKVGGSTFTSFKRSSSAGNGQAGLWGWMVDGAAGKCGVYFSDAGADDGAGNAYLLNGYYEGRGQATLTQSNFRRRIGGTAAPATGTWVRGDIVWNHAPVASGWAGWICVTSGAPGVWKGFGAIEA